LEKRRGPPQYQQKKEGSFSGNGKVALSSEQAEIVRLKRQLREAEIEREGGHRILKRQGLPRSEHLLQLFHSGNDGKFFID
jgi:transposase-like protein